MDNFVFLKNIISNKSFKHDDRGEEKQWRGRTAYDPRIDLGPRRDRLSGFRGYGGRDRVSDTLYLCHVLYTFLSSSMTAGIVMVHHVDRSAHVLQLMESGLTTSSLSWRERKVGTVLPSSLPAGWHSRPGYFQEAMVMNTMQE